MIAWLSSWFDWRKRRQCLKRIAMGAGVAGAGVLAVRWGWSWVMDMQDQQMRQLQLSMAMRSKLTQYFEAALVTSHQFTVSLCGQVLEQLDSFSNDQRRSGADGKRKETSLSSGKRAGLLSSPSPWDLTAADGVPLDEQLVDDIQAMVAVPSPVQLRDATLSKTDKIALWNELKNKTIVRLLASAYHASLIGLLVRIQVNLVGRYLHLEELKRAARAEVAAVTADEHSVPAEPGSDAPTFGPNVQSAFFSSSTFLVQQGFASLFAIFSQQCIQKLEMYGLEQKLTEPTLNLMFSSLRAATHDCFSVRDLVTSVALPPESEDKESLDHFYIEVTSESDKAALQLLINETRNILESNAAIQIFKESVDEFLKEAVSQTCTQLTHQSEIKEGKQKRTFSKPADSESPVTIDSNPGIKRSYPLAKCISFLRKQADRFYSNSLSLLQHQSSLKEFSYAVFCGPDED